MFWLQGQTVLITGGTGSFGKKCVEYLTNVARPKKIIVLSRDEQKHVAMRRDLFPPDRFPHIRYFVGDVRDRSRLNTAFRNVDYVIHAAAMKHVDMAEYNPQECIRTNIDGAENVIHAAIDAGVKKVIALSTDKAANPINLYGATKLCSDKLFVAANALAGEDNCKFSVVRYGNVLNSNGSVVPFFNQQREKGELPITDPQMTRFIITLQQAVEFVMKSFERMLGGEVFVPKIPSTTILDIAKAVAPECTTRIIGIRPGEKLHECMVPSDEARQTIEFDSHFVIVPSAKVSSTNPFLEFEPGNDESNQLSQGRPVSFDFSYTSDNNTDWLSIKQLVELIKLSSQPISLNRAA